MAKKLTGVVGVDVGSQYIKIAEIKMQGSEPTITAIGMAATPEGAVDHTGVYDSDAVGAVLKDLCASSGVTVPHAVVSIAGQASVLVRTLEVPKMSPNELKEHMQWEITRNIPFAESTVVSDYRPLDTEDPGAQNIDVVMAISPQSAVDTLVATIKKSGKQPVAIDVEPLGIARSLKQTHSAEFGQQTVCVVDIGHKTTSINMYKDGKLLMPRQVPIGGEMFTRAIADTMNVSMEEAEQIKQTQASIPASASANYGTSAATAAFQPYNPFGDDAPPAPADVSMGEAVVAEVEETGDAGEIAAEIVEAVEVAPAPVPVSSADSTRIFNAMAGVLEEFVAEVRRSVDYFRSKGGEVDRIELCGGASKIAGLPQFLSSSIGITTEMYDPLQGITINAKKTEDGTLANNRQDFLIAVGNGLHIAFE